MRDQPGYLLEVNFDIPQELRQSYPYNLPVLRTLKTLKFHPSVTYIIGENGLGKSTLMEAIAVYLGFNPEGGSKNFNFNTYASHSALHEHIRVAKSHRRISDGFFLRGESFYNLASEIEGLDKGSSYGGKVIDSYGGISLHELSHGESFWALFMNRFSGSGIYLLDEPESALSVQRQMAMLSRIHQLVGKGAQFLIATHSPILLAYPDSIIYQLGTEGIEHKKYQETELFSISKAFINDPDRMLSILLQQSDD